ncbi:MAG: thioredoxin domain-containing protein [Halobacteriales archaeon]
MTAPTDENRLGDAASPYLREHADNPVAWQPWDDQALSAARERDVPIFLSVGYAACHWCQVMAEESFEDESVAALLNDNFVPIKVDREERPDLDRVYQTIAQLVTRRGGWPLSAWLTPEGKPFYVGTYFPREPSRGMPAFPDLLEDIADSWADPDQRADMESRAEEWTDAVKGELEDVPEASEPPAETLESAASAAMRAADREHGGFGTSGPKFPQPSRLELLWRADSVLGRDTAREVAVEALDAMADGGLYDHVGGGFHRYATDRDWTVPHFEKMLYDQAELATAYVRGYQATGEDRYADVAAETFAFLGRELTHPDGGFYSTLDARSPEPESRVADGETAEKAEGAFYTWTPGGVEAGMAEEAGADAGTADLPDGIDPDRLADLARDRWGVRKGGNFEGTTVLVADAAVEDLAESYGLAAETVETLLAEARRRLQRARENRPRPRRDEKVLAGWNGLAISALAEGAVGLDPEYAETAEVALSFVRDHLWDGNRLARRYEHGTVGVDGYLEDYAFLARGAVDLYGATGDIDHLAFALALADRMVESFYDEGAGTLYFTPDGGEKLVARPQESKDQSTPSSLGVALEVLATLDRFVPHDRFGGVVEATLSTYGNRIAGNPLEHATLALVADAVERGHVELTLAVGGRGNRSNAREDAGGVADWPAEWRDRLGTTYLPARVLAPRPPTEAGLDAWLDGLGLAEAPPVWANRERRDGRPTVYACRGFACSPPTDEMATALAWLTENA